MASLFSRIVDLFSPGQAEPVYVTDPPIWTTQDTAPIQAQALEEKDDALAPLKNWSHPFKDKTNPLLQLTRMAKAVAGYYPLGRNASAPTPILKAQS